MGTSHSDKLNTLTRTIWEWCIANDIFLIAAHIPGVENKSADFESRIIRKETEWKLNTQFLHRSLSKLNFTPEINIFASRVNKQFSKYVSYRCDPGAIAIDAFTLDWHLLKFYALPPFSVIPKVLQKVTQDQATRTVVVPNWPTQLWYSKLMKLLISEPIFLPAGQKTLNLPSNPAELHALYKKLTLLVCLVSVNILQVQEFQKNLKNSLLDRGEKKLKNNTEFTSKSGKSVVVPQGVIQFHHL